MLERENWPYFLVVCLGVLSWVANDFVRSAREIAILTLDTDVSIQSDQTSEFSVEISNLSKTKFADGFEVSLITTRSTSFLNAGTSFCATATYSSNLRDREERNISCGKQEIIVPVVRLPPASSVTIVVQTAGRISQSAIQTKVFADEKNTTFSILSKFDVTALFLKFEWLILAVLAVITLSTLVRSIMRTRNMNSETRDRSAQKLAELLRVANTAQIRLDTIKDSTTTTAVKSDLDVILSGLRDLQNHLPRKEEPNS
jgi:hypothetical protein